jgi:UDP-3-O-[3-hydroxymyristoyl] glucosamine N-acyltransferase
MEHAGFFHRAGPFPLSVIADTIGAKLTEAKDGASLIEDVRPLRDAGPDDLAFFENRKYFAQLAVTKARACILSGGHLSRAPAGTATLATATPYDAFGRALTLFYPEALRSKVAASAAEQGGSLIHPSAQIAQGATIEPGAIIGRESVIGPGTVIAAGAVIGYRVVLGIEPTSMSNSGRPPRICLVWPGPIRSRFRPMSVQPGNRPIWLLSFCTAVLNM